ncbi:uncharacterized protein C16orf96 homolog isoform X4 [Ahaetulla prasina]|uniref:uncharacterized protein C16orf96 homolog isoform X4 n=1 Tax=Ahaetulla prasina TaxID=499056 RepID=UPI0026479597|nr:uncharacterized protein C16orf96 homolog isoform X4 [Ahaetulla prasina]
MSRTLSFVELINLAIGTPELGNVNFNALHLFLHSLVEHLRLHDVRKEVSAEELEFIKPPPSSGASAATSATETLPAVQKSSSIFHQMQERITAIERQLRFLNEPPDTAELLARSQGMGQPALDMWQMMQLKKKLELNEEGMTKAMNTLQDLLNSICSLKIATEGFQQELGQLKKDVAQINGEEMKERLLCLDKQARMMEEMKEQLGLVKERVSLSASASKVVSWSALCETLTGKGKESLQETLEQMERLREQFENLQQGVERLSRSSTEMQIIRNLLHQLDIKKADKDSIQEEMNVKADKSALEAMVNHGQLQLATSQLSEMMQDLLQKMSLQDKDWQKALEKLFVDMDCKLDRLALDPVSRQLEEVWKFIKKYLSEGPRFDADSAAGFKKQLFERVKCISCDRPVTMMTGPHMITVRKAMLKPRPVSASGYEYLFHQQKRDQDPSEMSSNPPLQTCWQCQAQQQACALKHLSRTQDFATLYPYGDPTAITYDNTEVDILGVNGVLYKGRVSSHAAERTFALQKEFAALKIPRPPTGVRMERVRSAFADISAVPYPSSVLRRVGSAIANSNQRPQQLSCDPVDRTIISGTLSESHVQNERNVPGLGSHSF